MQKSPIQQNFCIYTSLRTHITPKIDKKKLFLEKTTFHQNSTSCSLGKARRKGFLGKILRDVTFSAIVRLSAKSKSIERFRFVWNPQKQNVEMTLVWLEILKTWIISEKKQSIPSKILRLFHKKCTREKVFRIESNCRYGWTDKKDQGSDSKDGRTIYTWVWNCLECRFRICVASP